MSEMNEKPKYSGKSLVWPLILIGLGIVFLLDNLGVLNVNIGALVFRLWPLLLVAIGLDLLLGKRTGWWPAVSVAIILLIFGAGYWLMEFTGQAFNYSGEIRTIEFTYPTEDAERADVNLDFGVGQMELSALEDSSDLVSGKLVVADFDEITRDFEIKDGTAYFDLNSENRQVNPGWFFDQKVEDRVWELYLSNAVPIALDINTGVGQSIIDLRGLQIDDLDLSAGVGESRIYLPGEGQFDVSINGGVGSIRIVIPEEIAVRIRVSQGIGDVSVFGNHSFQNGSYQSNDYADADNKIDINVSGGIGEIVIVHE